MLQCIRKIGGNEVHQLQEDRVKVFLDTGEWRIIPLSEYHMVKDSQPETSRIGEMSRPIYSRVSPKVFDDFRERAKKEGLDMDVALATIVKAYSEGMVLTMPKRKIPQTGVDYRSSSQHPNKGNGTHYQLEDYGKETKE